MTDQEMIDKINSLVASQSVLQHLALALFDAIDDKTKVIKQFDETTSETYRLHSQVHPKSFLSTFQEYREIVPKLLVDTKAHIGPRSGTC
jgi:predicted RNA-binding Zn ribbon-like protein